MVIHIGEIEKPLHNNSIERCSVYFLVQDLEDLVELKGKDFVWMKEKYIFGQNCHNPWNRSMNKSLYLLSLNSNSKPRYCQHIYWEPIYNNVDFIVLLLRRQGDKLFIHMCLSVNPSLCLSYQKILSYFSRQLFIVTIDILIHSLFNQDI